MINKVQIEGRVSTVPTVRKFDNGEILMFSVVVNEKYVAKNGEQMETAYFFDVEAIGPAASTTINKGDIVLIEGQLRQDRWETPSGEKRSKVKIVAFRISPQQTPEKPEAKQKVVAT